MEQVSVIIVNWNTGKLLSECIASLSALHERSHIRHIVVIDNGSKDASLELAKTEMQRAGAVLLVQKENLGFAKANNVGIRYVREHGGDSDHILLLNPDTRVHSGAIHAMLDVLETNPRAGIVGPMLLELTGEVQPSVRSFPTRTILLLQFVKLHRIFKQSAAWKRYMRMGFDYEKQQIVDQVMGAAFLVRNTVMKQLNGLDESFFVWFEEVDFCKRATDAGYEVVYTPNGQVTHAQGSSFNQLVGILKTKPFLDSSLTYIKKHFGMLTYLAFAILYPVGLFIALLASVVHIGQKEKNMKRL